jgi:hypothetical protein
MVLVTALAGTDYPLSVTICNDKTPVGYNQTKSSNNAPQCGTSTLGVAASSLGLISVGECTYSTTGGGNYGGYLPETNGWVSMAFNVGDPNANPSGTPINIWVNSDVDVITGTTGGIINQDCNGLPIISSVNGPICWSLAATGFYCLTLPVASTLTGNNPCIPYPNEPAPTPVPPTPCNWCCQLEKWWFNLLLWNKWIK